MPLVLVPTPLGNLRDITLRALDVLREAELIVAEDTRVARRLLSAHSISPRELGIYNEHTGIIAMEKIVERAATVLVAVVSDAGMPGINDPGARLVAAARAAGVGVEVLPGPSAFVGALVLSAFPTEGASYEGFAPRTDGARTRAFAEVFARRRTSVWYDSPNRIAATLDVVAAIAPGVRVLVLREYTKRFEEQLIGSPAEVRGRLADPVRGEITFAVDAADFAPQASEHATLESRIDALAETGLRPKEIARALASDGLGERREIYRIASERGKAEPPGTI